MCFNYVVARCVVVGGPYGAITDSDRIWSSRSVVVGLVACSGTWWVGSGGDMPRAVGALALGLEPIAFAISSYEI